MRSPECGIKVQVSWDVLNPGGVVPLSPACRPKLSLNGDDTRHRVLSHAVSRLAREAESYIEPSYRRDTMFLLLSGNLEVASAMTWPEIVDLVCKVLRNLAVLAGSVAALFGSIAACRGVSAWRKQLIGQDAYNLAKRLLTSIFQLEKAIKRFRSPSGLF